MRNVIVAALIMCSTCAYGAEKRRDIYTGLLDEVIPQVADGDGWKTTITLVNIDTQPVQWTLTFFDPQGKTMPVALAGRGPATHLYSGTIPTNGSIVLETTGSGPLVQGWALAESNQEMNGLAVFGFSGQDGRTQEAVVPFCSWSDDDFYLAFDNTNGFTTSMAMVFPRPAGSRSDETITVAFFDEAGNRIHLDQFVLKAGTREAFETARRWPQIAGRRGVMRFTTSSLYFSALGLRFHPSGSFTSVHTLSK